MTDDPVLSAFGCHTTLKPGATVLDKALFVADKVEWSRRGVSPSRTGRLSALESSLDAAACCSVHALGERRGSLTVIRRWVVAAHREMCGFSAFVDRVAPR